MKTHLKRVVAEVKHKFEEFTIVHAQIMPVLIADPSAITL